MIKVWNHAKGRYLTQKELLFYSDREEYKMLPVSLEIYFNSTIMFNKV